MDILLFIAAIAAAALTAIASWALRGREIARAVGEREAAQKALADSAVTMDALRATVGDVREEAATLRGQLDGLTGVKADLDRASERIADLRAEAEGLRAAKAAMAEDHARQVAQLTALRQEVQDQFKLLATDVVKSGSEDFLKRAEDLFKAQKQLTAAEIDKRAKDIADTVKPLGDSLKAYEAMVKEIEKARAESYGGIDRALRSVQLQQDEVKTVTAHLVNALKASPKTRGRWGEETLKRVVELSGMVEHCDFDTEFSIADENLRPDMVIRVSGGRAIVVDAKAPLSAYLDAVNATSEEERDRLLTLHAKQLRERLTNLSSKSYWAYFHDSIDYVVMFVPGDNFVSAAFERDTALFEDGLKHRVLVCTPTTFIALVKAISYGWRQEQLAKSAIEVGRLGKDLYMRLSAMGDHVTKLGRNIDAAAKGYNSLVGSLENSVLPQARKFNELGVEGTAKDLPELADVDTATRLPAAGRDLQLTPPDASEY